MSCPSTQNSIVPHPWAKYKPGKAPDNIRVASSPSSSVIVKASTISVSLIVIVTPHITPGI